jgi:acid phosphatase type 7
VVHGAIGPLRREALVVVVVKVISPPRWPRRARSSSTSSWPCDPDEGYYSYNRGNWHVVALNCNCEKIGGCGDGSPQIRWLKEDLAANDAQCTLAYFHHPRFTSGEYRPGISKVESLWEALYGANADVVLSAHDHNYQRFVPQNPAGKVDLRRGISQFVVGTGGAEDLYAIEAPLKNVAAYTDETYGVLRIELRPESYKWRFVGVKWWLVDVKWWFVGAVGEEFEDSGTARCH